jgi:hypothetical protein
MAERWLMIAGRPIAVRARAAEMFRAGLAALGAEQAGRQYYWQHGGDVYILNREAILAAGAASLAGLPKEVWMPAWRSQFPLRKLIVRRES